MNRLTARFLMAPALAAGLLAGCSHEPSFPPIDSPVPGHVQSGVPPAEPPPPANAASVATCAGTDILSLVGQNVSKLPASGPWTTVRILKPGMAATMDFSPTRLNVMVDASGKILSLTCG